MFDVALLIERQLNDLDADQIVALHEGLDDTVRYHLLLPVENSTDLLMSSMGALGGQMMPLGRARRARRRPGEHRDGAGRPSSRPVPRCWSRAASRSPPP